MFREHCSGCHTLGVAGAQGSATSITNRVKTNGPNFNIRKEQVEQVLYAMHNGGFSGAIMPQNIVVGQQAQQVAEFLAKYSGRRPERPGDEITQSTSRPHCGWLKRRARPQADPRGPRRRTRRPGAARR